ncbi:hypothetical protein LAZ40_09435 [Cereibacter sphaeroides]|uniref:hypothetical protein n=1 Tax=Cereibacter sphaeroides TaxID=1063 RepID=UPI001F25C333|nr:hypothetical protein [Cereibacter sphaeroides]MCE6959274.1 hypothetical protein [Cereibacter sphaeroides]MCE6972866.1 hypothetical protein [Cereibacter sphaeroides]
MLRAFLLASALSLAALSNPSPVLAFDMTNQADVFDASRLSPEEIRFVQSMLAFNGEYDGMIDGKWGPASQRGLQSFMKHMGLKGDPLLTIVMIRVAEHQQRFAADSWERVHFGGFDISFLAPDAIEQINVTPPGLAFSTQAYPLIYGLDHGLWSQLGGTHEGLLEKAFPGTKTYTVRKPNLKITAVTTRLDRIKADAAPTEVVAYLRSDRHNGSWTTLFVMTGGESRGLISMVAGSVVPGRGEPIGLPPGGELDTFIREATQTGLFGTFDEDGNIAPPPGAQAADKPAPAEPVRPAPAAASACRSWRDRVTLTGTIRKQSFPGAPNYESIAAGDEEEIATILTLDEPLCLMESPGEEMEPAMAGIREMQVVMPLPASTGPVSVTGTPFYRYTGHHHTEVLLDNQ